MLQHFVSECYLKQFIGKKNELYYLDERNKIQPCYPKGICKLEEINKISNEHLYLLNDCSDNNIVEKSFKRFEDLYPKVLEEIKSKITENHSFNILEKYRVIILQMLINNKTRHPIFRKETFDRTFSNISLEPFLEESKKSGISPEKLRIEFINHISNKHTFKNLYNVYQYNAEIDFGRKEIYEFLKRFAWEILLIKDNINSFLTSDSPGFTKLCSGIITNFGSWSYANSYYFPLTPKILLKIDFSKTSETIVHKEIFSEEIDEVNLNMFKTKIDNFYCCSKPYLQYFLKYKET